VLGDRAFVALGRIADHGESAEVDEELDDIRRDYRTVFEDSLALVEARVVRSRRAAVRKAARKATTESAESAKSVEKQGGPPAAVSGASPTRIHRLRTAVTRRLRHR
jgi:hypothetical protein